MAPRAGSEQAGPPRGQRKVVRPWAGSWPCPAWDSPDTETLRTFPHRVSGNWCSLLVALGKINKPNKNKTTEINL